MTKEQVQAEKAAQGKGERPEKNNYMDGDKVLDANHHPTYDPVDKEPEAKNPAKKSLVATEKETNLEHFIKTDYKDAVKTLGLNVHQGEGK